MLVSAVVSETAGDWGWDWAGRRGATSGSVPQGG
jgi:hypothetical protein